MFTVPSVFRSARPLLRKETQHAPFQGSNLAPHPRPNNGTHTLAQVLNESPNASMALDLIKQQEMTKAAEHRRQEAEYAAYVKQMEVCR